MTEEQNFFGTPRICVKLDEEEKLSETSIIRGRYLESQHKTGILICISRFQQQLKTRPGDLVTPDPNSNPPIPI